MLISVSATKDDNRADATTTYTITTNTTIGMGISCITKPCLKYNPNTRYDLVANIFNDPGKDYSLIWSTSNPLLNTYGYFNTFRFYGPTINTDTNTIIFQVDV